MAEIPPLAAYLPAARAALAAFGMAGAEPEVISRSENVVYRVTDAGGTAYALRLHRPGYHARAALDSERLWTAELAAKGMIVPTGQRTADGAWYAVVETPDPEGWRHAGLTVWHPGETLQTRLGDARGPEVWPWFERAGALLADLHNHTAAWTPPPGFVRHSLDVDGFVGEAPFWGRFWEASSLTADEQRLLGTAREWVREGLTQLRCSDAPFGLIHADAHPGNVLVSGRAGEETLGLIDFDDCTWGWLAFDLAVLLHSVWADPAFPEIREGLLAGYASRRALPADILPQLDLFLLVRTLMLVGWRDMRPEVTGHIPVESWKPTVIARVARALGSGA